MYRLINFCSICYTTIFLFSSCSTEKDFSGTYHTMFSHKISTSDDEFKSDITELSLFQLKVYKTNNSYSGDVSFTRSFWDYQIFKPVKKISNKEKLILSNIRQNGDTLFYIMSDNFGLNLDGALIKNDSVFHILDIKLSGSNMFTEQNPLFVSKSKEYITYRNISKDLEDSIRKEFLEIELSFLEKVYKPSGMISSKELDILKQMIP